MLVGMLKVNLMIYEAQTLKEKRRVLLSVKERLRRRFNASVSEVDHQDLVQRCTLGIALVSNEARAIHAQLDQMLDLIRAEPRVSLLECERLIV